MRKAIAIIKLMLVGGFLLMNASCEQEAKETCQQDVFCDGSVTVTASCTNGKDCYFTYNGEKYPDTEEGIDNLINDLNCSTAKNFSSVEEKNAYFYQRLQWLVQETRILSRQ